MAVKATALLMVVVAVLVACSACTSGAATQLATLRQLEGRGLQQPATDVCTKNGSTPLPLTGDVRVVAAVNSTWDEARRLVQPKFEKTLSPDLTELKPDAKVAICFIQTPKSMVPPDGRSVIVQVANLGPNGAWGTW